MSSYPRTPNAGLPLPSYLTRQWNVPLNATIAALDEMARIGGLCVTAVNVDDAGNPTDLNVALSGGTFLAPGGVYTAVAPIPGFTMPASATTYLWLDAAGAFQTGSAWPTADHVRLAVVVTDAAKVTSITDARVSLTPTGAAPPTLTGSRGGNAALANLITFLASKGWFVDGTTA